MLVFVTDFREVKLLILTVSYFPCFLSKNELSRAILHDEHAKVPQVLSKQSELSKFKNIPQQSRQLLDDETTSWTMKTTS